jgi:hypothetical protein
MMKTNPPAKATKGKTSAKKNGKIISIKDGAATTWNEDLKIEDMVDARDSEDAPCKAMDLGDENKPVIFRPCDGKPPREFAIQLGAILADKGLFRVGETVNSVDMKKKKLKPVSARSFLTMVERHVRVVKTKVNRKTEEEFIALTSLNYDQVQTVMASEEFLEQIPEVRALHFAPQPVMRPATPEHPNGKIEMLPVGYDVPTQIYTVDTGVTIDETVTAPDAVEHFQEMLSTFDLVHGESHDERMVPFSILIAGMLSVFGRELDPSASLRPAYIFSANRPGSGKTTLAQLMLSPCYGLISATAVPSDPNEFEKTFHSVLRSRAPYVLFDNVRFKLASGALEAYLTSKVYTYRVLQASQQEEVENIAPIVITANHFEPSEDLRERSLEVKLWQAESDLDKRNVPDDKLLTNNTMATVEMRSKNLSCLWAIVKAWDTAGRPKLKLRRQFRFPVWAQLFGGMCHAVALGDILFTTKTVEGERLEVMKLIGCMAHAHEHGSVMNPEWSWDGLATLIGENGIFEQYLEDGKIDKRGKGRVAQAVKDYLGMNHTLPLAPLDVDDQGVPIKPTVPIYLGDVTHARWKLEKTTNRNGAAKYRVIKILEETQPKQ